MATSLEERIARLWSTPGHPDSEATTLLDGRRIDSRDHYLAWIAEDALERLETGQVTEFPDGRRIDSREAVEEWLIDAEGNTTRSRELRSVPAL